MSDNGVKKKPSVKVSELSGEACLAIWWARLVTGRITVEGLLRFNAQCARAFGFAVDPNDVPLTHRNLGKWQALLARGLHEHRATPSIKKGLEELADHGVVKLKPGTGDAFGFPEVVGLDESDLDEALVLMV